MVNGKKLDEQLDDEGRLIRIRGNDGSFTGYVVDEIHGCSRHPTLNTHRIVRLRGDAWWISIDMNNPNVVNAINSCPYCHIPLYPSY